MSKATGGGSYSISQFLKGVYNTHPLHYILNLTFKLKVAISIRPLNKRGLNRKKFYLT